MKTKKTILFFLSAMVMVLAVGCTSNKNSKGNLSVNESSKEERTSRERKREENDEASTDSLLSIGQTATASKTIIDTENRSYLENVSVTLSKVIRGTEAKEIVDKFNEENPSSKISSLIDDSLEYVVIEYNTSLGENIKSTKYGQTSNVQMDLVNLNNNTLLSYDNNYIIRKSLLKCDDGLQSGDSGITKVVVTLPKNITEFIIKLGDDKENMSYFLVK